MGSGVTAGMNKIAQTLKRLRPERDMVLVSMMEHHSNDLPHRKHGGHVIHIPVDTHESKMGCVDMELLEHYLREYEGRVNYVSITGISNVTGIINPINEVAKLAHHYGAYIVVDAAQMAAHVPIHMSGNKNPDMDVDALIFSGHKTYAPGSPGVVVARKDLIGKIEYLQEKIVRRQEKTATLVKAVSQAEAVLKSAWGSILDSRPVLKSAGGMAATGSMNGTR